MSDPCCVCSVETAKYRCPHCRLRYCSLDCCRRHKEGCVPKEASSSSVAGVPDVFPTRVNLPDENEESDAVPLQKLTLLGLSEELKGLLLNTHLRQLLVTLDQTENKDEALKKYMQEPLFVEFADKCLSVVVEEKENLFSK
ncbi:zinc finger HIT domain-containing protein 3 isoform X2 [Phyllobates terribilis]|uniref:zinc finger HIT domain-containing protein 3 isoform X2 n=1 Tax=Phyllobates terribilis TaxID=111132 RepID=UPI003CCA79F6